jgi:DNA-binding NarL/FixJ family response regulator
MARLAAMGIPNREIATHRSKIFSKLGISNRTQLQPALRPITDSRD